MYGSQPVCPFLRGWCSWGSVCSINSDTKTITFNHHLQGNHTAATWVFSGLFSEWGWEPLAASSSLPRGSLYLWNVFGSFVLMMVQLSLWLSSFSSVLRFSSLLWFLPHSMPSISKRKTTNSSPWHRQQLSLPIALEERSHSRDA